MENAPITVVRTFDDIFGNGEISSPTGLTFVPGANVFLTQPANSSDITAVTSTQEEVNTSLSANLPASIKAINLAFDPQSNRLLGLNPSGNRLTEVALESNNNLSRSTTEEIDVKSLDIKNARGISVASDGTLYVLDGAAKEIIRAEQNADGNFEESSISQIELPARINNPKGIAFNSTTGNLHVYNSSSQELFELSQQGEIVAVRDFSSLGIRQPESFIFAPSGDLTDAPEQLSLYVADGAPNSGGIVELSLEEPAAAEPAVSRSLSFAATASTTNAPSLVQTIDTSQFSPSSPDPAGIAFLDFSNTLLISDSEVNENPFFGTENLFESSLTGSLINTFDIRDFSREPTGVAYNPANQHLFISNDDADEIVELDPGADLVYDTADDVTTIIDTNTFGSFDPEGIAYASDLGTLFVADGVNSEVYQISTNGTLISSFDTDSLGVSDPEGIEYDSSNGNLYLIGNPIDTLAEVTTSGTLVSTIDISAANPVKPAGLGLGRNSQNSANSSIYITDRGIDNNADPNENDGKVYEFSLGGGAPPPAEEFSTIYISSDRSGSVDGLAFKDEDILAFDIATETWSLYFDGSDASLNNSTGGPDNYAFDIDSDGSILLSLDRTATLPDVGSIDENDIVRFVPTSLGTNTTGTYEWYLDGSDVGLTGTSEDIDAIATTTDGRLVISTKGSFNATGVSGKDEDLFVFNATSFGESTSGTFELYLDSSDVGLGNPREDINAAWIDSSGEIYLSNDGAFDVPGATGDGSDILSFTPDSLGANSTGTFNLFWDGSENGFGGNIDGLALV